MSALDERAAESKIDPVFVGAWKTLEESGSWLALELHFTGKLGQKAARDANGEVAKRLEESKRRLAEALEYERIHGSGSLLVHEHPFNVRMARHLAKAQADHLRTAA